MNLKSVHIDLSPSFHPPGEPQWVKGIPRLYNLVHKQGERSKKPIVLSLGGLSLIDEGLGEATGPSPMELK